MMKNGDNRATDLREAFLAWGRRSAITLPTSNGQALGRDAQAALDRMLKGKRFVFLGEPEHCIVEKYPFRLVLIRYLFEHGWRHAAMETGRSAGWRVDRYLESGDASCLDAGILPPKATDVAVGGKMLEFIEGRDKSFHEQLRQVSESRGQGTPRLRYWGYDLDLGMPLGALEAVRRLLEGATDGRIQDILSAIEGLKDLSVDQQLAQIAAIQNRLGACTGALTDEVWSELQSWMSFLHDSVAAENRPRMNRDRRGHRRWRAQREHSMMQYLDAIVDALSPDDRLILMGHNVHLSKDGVGVYGRPQLSGFWGLGSWLRGLGYEAFSRLTRCPLDGGLYDGSVGSHLHARFPGQVLSIWMLYGQGTLMMSKGPHAVRLRDDTVESLLARVGDRFLLPLDNVDPQSKAVLSNANLRLSWGLYVSADLTVQADAICFVKDVSAG